MRGSRDMFGGGGSMFNDPFFSNDPFHAVHHDPFFSGFGGGGGMHGGTGMSHPMMHQQQHQQMLRGGMMDPLFSSSSFSSSSSSFGGGGGVSKSVSQSTQIVNGQAQTVTVTKVQDQNGTTITEDYGNGRRRVVVNGVEQHSTLGQGESNDNRRYISEGSSSAPYDRRRRF
ncbi:hypothetical protein BDA99DRAFT_162829 [Phascolomyces articulosus]|uniref:Uncharacterized protein n=1 Tax=Phascolomyces articulosus TaxID=60185 RepID=A0AAD5JTG2_9FUNG|nr:hypothetical protein BDA99DRAFT_162829 [Phascolomyces articulosus]